MRLPLYGMPGIGRAIEVESRLVVARSGGGGGEWLLTAVSFRGDENALEVDRGGACMAL